MRQFKILCAGLTLVVGTAGSIRGGDDDRGSVWADDLPHATWTDHLQRPPTFFSPAGWSPSFFVTDQAPGMFGVQAPSMTGVGCGKCQAIDPVTAEFIATDRQNSPVARFGASLQLPSLPDHGASRAAAVRYAVTPSTIPGPSPMYFAAPVYTQTPVYTHPAHAAPAPLFESPIYSCPPQIHFPPAVAYRAEPAGTTARCCASSACKCTDGACQCMQCACKCAKSTAKCAECDDKCISDCDQCNDAPARLEHMLEACHHLEQAGMNDEANRLRKQCVAEMRDVLQRLKTAESELARLREEPPEARPVSHEMPTACPEAANSACCNQKAGRNKMVMVQAQILEVNRTKLRDFDMAKLNGCPENASSMQDLLGAAMGLSVEDRACAGSWVFDQSNGLLDVIEALRKEGIATVISRPKLVTMSGSFAIVQVGSEVPPVVPQGPAPVSIDYADIGTRLELLPLVTKNNNIRMEVRAQVTDFDKSKAGQARPFLRTHRIETVGEVKGGQTLVLLGGLVKERTEIEETESGVGEAIAKDSKIFRRVRTERKKIEKPVEYELLMILRPEIVDVGDLASACKLPDCFEDECIPCTVPQSVPSTCPATIPLPAPPAPPIQELPSPFSY